MTAGTEQRLVIGTAGHIDHGKTSLVRALTGVDLDRLPEERERGITIALGFTHLSLPNGRNAALVDVPGHERLVRTMISGATGLDAALLCVSAVDGVMPQTREHLAILDLLGVQAGVVVLTMSDLVDEETLELAQLDVEELVEGTFLEGAPVCVTAAGPELRGIDDLRQTLANLEIHGREGAGPLRLPVDRAFVRAGFGTVVTGTLRSGRLEDGDEVELLPEGLRCRVRGVQVHGEPVAHATVGQRTAANLAGIERDDLHRGMVVCHPGVLPPCSILDAHLTTLAGAPPLQAESRVRLLVGTAEVLAVVTLIATEGGALAPDQLEEGSRAFIQLRTEAPIVAMPGDRFIARRESPVETLGGGVLLDPWARRVRRRDSAPAAAALRRLHAGDRAVFLERAGDLGLPPAQAGLRSVPESAAVVLAETWLHPTVVSRLEERLLAGLADAHAERPLSLGVSRRELHRPPLGHLPARLYDALVERLVDRGEIVIEGPRMRLPTFSVQLSPAQQARSQHLENTVRDAGLEGPKAGDLLKSDPELIHLLTEAGALVRVADKLLHREPLAALVETVRSWLTQNGEMGATDFKALTGLSRKHAIPLLEWLDSEKVTMRQGDTRRLR